jgi:hypothetical protein
MKYGNLKEAKTFAKEIVYIRGHFISFKDEHGECIYTFKEKKEADLFYKALMASVKMRKAAHI